MFYAGKPIASIAFHKKCAPALAAALDEIWTACGKDQAAIVKAGLQEYGRSFNHRLIRGRSEISNHSFAIAIDIGKPSHSITVSALDDSATARAPWYPSVSGRLVDRLRV